MQAMRRRHLLFCWGSPAAATAAGEPKSVPLAVGEHGVEAQWGSLLDWLARVAGLRWELHPLPWPRAQAFAESGRGLIFGLARTAQRQPRFVFSQGSVELGTWALVRQGEAAALSSGFAQRVVCMGRGSAYPSSFAERGIAVGRWLESDQGNPAATRMLLAGRCDAAVLSVAGRDAATVLRRLPSLGIDTRGLELLPRPLMSTPLHFATGLRSSWLPQLRRVDAALLRERAAIERLMREAG